MKPFQVNTLGNADIKHLFVRLFEKKTGRKETISVQNEKCKYWQFWFEPADVFQSEITHSTEPFDPEKWPVISIEEAIRRLTPPEPRVKTIALNSEYSAVITEGKNEIKVGCQTIPISAVKELHAAILELETPTTLNAK